jgi:hypothetical protein
MRYASFYPMIAVVAAIGLGVAARAAEPQETCGKMAGTEKAACMEQMGKAKGMAAKEHDHMKGRSSEMKGMGAQEKGKGAEMRKRAEDAASKAKPK